MTDLNNKISQDLGLTFDDVLLLPNYTEVRREDIDVSVQLTQKIKLAIPLLSAPMDTVTTAKLAIALGKLGGLGVIHRNLSKVEQVAQVAQVKKEGLLAAAAVGVGKDIEERVAVLVKAGTDVLLIDSAHGFSKWVIEATQFIADKYKNIALISGSVATAAGAKALITAGAAALRVGMGPGSICTTRVVAGMGVPQITSILETAAVAKQYAVPVISDGGLRFSGDIVKALSAGASTVMSGSLFAGCEEAPGKIVTVDGKKYKSYRGMGSLASMKEGSAARYGQEYRLGQEKKLIAEGVEGLVPYKGTVKDSVVQLIGGLRAGMYYAGVKNITELGEKTRLVRVTQASLVESHPHDIIIK
ncbi:IMP dehydrogenase [Candidatus Gottesmanbacteria bacterium]|nr:IMP dehydrogenase [Candidatus Gottesmanbacteria bacterium]